MSSGVEVAFAPTEVTVREAAWDTIQLGDILGRIPVKELIEELDVSTSCWTCVDARQHYCLELEEGVRLDLQIREHGQVEISRQVVEAETVEVGSVLSVRQRQRELLQQTSETCQLSINQLLAKAMLRAVPNRVREMELEIKNQEVHQEGCMFHLTIETEVQVQLEQW